MIEPGNRDAEALVNIPIPDAPNRGRRASNNSAPGVPAFPDRASDPPDFGDLSAMLTGLDDDAIASAGVADPSTRTPGESWAQWRTRVGQGLGSRVRGAASMGGSAVSGIGRLAERATKNRATALVRNGVENWARNLNPVGKDRYWFLGVAAGTVSTVAINEIAFGPAASPMRAGVTLAGSLVASEFLKYKYIGQQIDARRNLTDAALTAELQRLENDYNQTASRVKKFFAGVSAGATFGGLGYAFAGEAIHEQVKGVMDHLNTPGADHIASTVTSPADTSSPEQLKPESQPSPTTTPPTPEQGTPPPAPTAPPASNLPLNVEAAPVETITLQSGSNPTEAVTKFLVDHGVKPTPENVHEAVTKFMDQNGIVDAHKVAANVAFKAEGLVASAVSLPDNIAGLGIDELAKNVDLQHVVTNIINSETVTPDKLVNEAVNQMNLHSGGVPESIYRGTQQAISEKLHEVFNQAVVDSHATTADAALAAGKKAIEAQITDPAMHSNIIDFTQKALETGIQENANMFHEVLTNSSSNMTEVVIPAGSNVSTILEQSGHHINWTPDNAELFGSEIAVNFDTLTNYWGLMDKAGYLPAGAHFPATMSELYQIIEKAKSGDVGAIAAMDNLKRMLRYVPAGMKLRVLNEAGVGSVVGALKALAKAA